MPEIKIRTYFSLPLVLIVSLFLFSGCKAISRSMIQDVSSDAPVLPGAFTSSGSIEAPAKFWEAFGDTDLNGLVEKAISDSYSVKAAWARLEQADAIARKAGASRLPSLSASASAQKSRTHNGQNGNSTDTESFSLGLAASYELDLWGRVAAAARAGRFSFEASEEDLQTLLLSVAAQVSGTWFDLLSVNCRIQVLTEQIKTAEKYLELVKLRKNLRAGTPLADVLQQQQQLESLRGELTQQGKEKGLLENQLCILTGEVPGSCSFPERFDMPVLPQLPSTGIPSEVLRQRPDVRAAELRIKEASERLNSAIADRFPRISLGANALSETEELRDFFDNWLASIAAELIAPLFDGGSRKAEVDRTGGALKEAFYTYSQTLLEAVGEVQDALVSEKHQMDYIQSLHTQLELSKGIVSNTLLQYQNGSMDYLRVLTAVTTKQKLQLQYISAQQQGLTARISLYRALAGNWDRENDTQ